MFSELFNLFKILDVKVFYWINDWAGKWQVLDYLAIFFANYLGYVLLISLAVFLIIDLKKYWKMAFESIIVALFVRFVIIEIIKAIKFRPRPFTQDEVNLIMPYDSSETSFPSGHASFFFALSTIIYCYNKKVGILFYAASFLISISRVFAGVHWPSDILAGALLGIVAGFILKIIKDKSTI